MRRDRGPAKVQVRQPDRGLSREPEGACDLQRDESVVAGQRFELARRVPGPDMFMSFALATAKFGIGLLTLAGERYFEVEVAAWADELRHSCEDRTIFLDVLEAFDREDEIGCREQIGEIWIEQVALPEAEIGQLDTGIGSAQVHATNRQAGIPAGQPGFVESASAADREGASESSRALDGIEEMRQAK